MARMGLHSREDVVRLGLTIAAALAFAITVFTLVVFAGGDGGVDSGIEAIHVHPDDVGVVDEGLGIGSLFDPDGAYSPNPFRLQGQ